jgi:hypothetical protein
MVEHAGQTPIVSQAPPSVPASAQPEVKDYLTRFALWTRNNLSAKLSSTHALPGILLQAKDSTKVFLIEVDSSGTITATAQPLGQGKT